MKYLIYPLKVFLEQHLDTARRAQKEIYPEEDPTTVNQQQNYFENTRVLVAMNESDVVGFNAIIICTDPRSKELYASSLWFQVDKEYREGSIGGVLIKRSEEIATTFGCRSYKWDAPVNSSLERTLSKRSDYIKESVIFNKSLL